MANDRRVDCCGLVKIVKKGEAWEPPVQTPIPLMSVSVNASVVHSVAQVEVTQVYVNQEEQPIEAIYYFPINPEGAVTHFQAEIEGRIIKGTVKAHEEAKKAYDKAVEGQTTAFLGEETKADIFKVRVGFLKPGVQAKVVIGYVTEVKNEPGSNSIRFYIPTTIAPRYVSPTETDEKAEDIKQMKFSSKSPAPLTVKVAVSLQGKIKSIESPTHKVKVEKIGSIPERPSWEKAIVELAGETTDMDRDFVLNIVPEEKHKARLYSEKLEDGSTAMMVHLVPSFKLDEQKTEIIFVLDRSGSMMGQSIDLARKAMMVFLHSMPADCYFNVVGFGSTYQFLFPSSVKYDDGSLKKAVEHSKGLEANLGGTEIYEPLNDIYAKPGIDGYLRQIFILTDGEVSNTDAVLGIAQANAHKARVFALGIGDGASHYLVEGIAKAGGGTSAFVTYNETIDKKVLNQLKNGLQPSLTEVQLEWEGVEVPKPSDKKQVPVNKEKTLLGYNKPIESTEATENMECDEIPRSNKQSPKRIPPVYDGSQLLVFGLFKDALPNAVSIKAQSPDGPLTVKIEHVPENDVGSTGMLHKLAAIKLVRELELEVAALGCRSYNYSTQSEQPDTTKEEEGLKKEIIEIGCKHGVTSKFTSFVAIDVNDDKPSKDCVMGSRQVPSQFANGWHGGVGGFSMRGGGGPGPMPMAYCSMAMPAGNAVFASFGRPIMGGMSKSAKSKCRVKRAMCDVQAEMGDEVHLRSRSEPDDQPMAVDEAEPSTPVVRLISLQSFDGSFNLDEHLCTVLEKTLRDLQQAATKNGYQEKELATALAIAYFKTKLASDKDTWDLVVVKANKWLVKALPGAKADEIISLATSML